MRPATEADSSQRMPSPWVKLGVLLALIIGAGWLVHACGLRVSDITPEKIRGFVLGFGGWAVAVYVAAYGQPVIPLPASIMTAAAGLAFGLWWGLPAALVGVMARAGTQFALGRTLGRHAIASLLRGRAAALDRKLGEHSFMAVFLIRLIPNFPFDVQNYALASSQVRFAPYMAGTFLGVLPGSVLYVWVGHSISDPQHLWKLLLAILLVIGLVVGRRAWVARRLHAQS